ncbi:MAG: putative aldouronate transport system substrate-binding protein [Streptomyces sp.]|jgi:putative aldouronate transport system substrate-binding protein|nr:putative aldouronate transport system substrate-binding protein [Streptomyces sp.]
MSTPNLSRRTLFKGAALTALSGTALNSLTACSPGTGGGSTAAAGKAVPVPTYVSPVKPKPLYAGNAQGVMDVYAAFPTNGPTTVTGGPVGDGSDFNVLVMTYGQPAPPLDKNAYWQLLNKELNVNVKPQLVPAADFATKFPALVAGNDLPEVVSIPIYMNVARLPQLAQAQFTDLSEYLSGDAVKKYPNLAGIQEANWLNGYLNGRIYGVPKSDPVFTSTLYTKTDVIKQAGGNPQPTTLAEFKDLAKAVNNPKAGIYAFCGGVDDITFAESLMMSFGVPNKWTQKGDGTFVSSYEHEQFIPAVAAVADLHASGYFHPDTATMSKVQRDALFRSGKLAVVADGNRAMGIIADDHALEFGMIAPFAAEGGKAAYWQGGGAYAITMLKKTTDKKRIDRFLRVLDYIAAPFGSRESFVMSYGAEGSDYTVKSGVPVLTTRGQREQDLGLAYIVGGPQVLCDPQGAPGADKQYYDWQQKAVPLLVPNPAAHLYSQTYNTKGSSLEQKMRDAVISVFLGRSKASSLKDAVATWKQSGGDQMAREYADSLKKSS